MIFTMLAASPDPRKNSRSAEFDDFYNARGLARRSRAMFFPKYAYAYKGSDMDMVVNGFRGLAPPSCALSRLRRVPVT